MKGLAFVLVLPALVVGRGADAGAKSLEDFLPPRLGRAERQPVPDGVGRFDGFAGTWVEARYQVAGDGSDSHPRALRLNVVQLDDPATGKNDFFVVRRPGQTRDRNDATFEGVKIDGRFVQRRHDHSGTTGKVTLLLAARVLVILELERPVDREESARWLKQLPLKELEAFARKLPAPARGRKRKVETLLDAETLFKLTGDGPTTSNLLRGGGPAFRRVPTSPPDAGPSADAGAREPH